MTEPARVLVDHERPALKPSERRLASAALAVRKLAEKQRVPLRQMFLTARDLGLFEASDEELDDVIAFAGALTDIPSQKAGG